MIDLRRAHAVAVEAAEAAGAVLAPGARFDVRAKGGAGDLVTDLDLRSEKIIIDRLLSAFPDHAVLAEESGRTPGNGPLWVIDPLDGTHNLTIGLPAYSVGVALCVDGAPAVGVVHDPVTGQTWSAVRGGGPLGPGGTPLPPPEASPRKGLIVSYIVGYPVSRDDPTAMAHLYVLNRRCSRVLALWSPQLTWIMLARGLIDAVIGYRTGPVDLPAGALIATEAGARLTTLDGAPFPVCVEAPEHTFVAARPEAAAELLPMLASAAALRMPEPA
ncbi:myo-inositol-1(or 4)-monophosphatase [Actinocorallia herbida]|uniref:Myo-inositol-1(Or 4)-monophosphatase n=1 Tax=Actinocorallia herbida TaxID=58109 RepID=A0A3N1CRW4_9ACTN|nr:inositol monophosphatase family protein [Actinocorallia herbida]ROO84037.1 myo-inositol-1(or 4)-monophosphatase [Actinocorallia herbida]